MRIIITIDGGLVDWVQTDATEPVEVMIRNLDIEGCDESFDRVTRGTDEHADAYVTMDTLQTPDEDNLKGFDEIWNHFKPKGK